MKFKHVKNILNIPRIVANLGFLFLFFSPYEGKKWVNASSFAARTHEI